LEHPESIDDVVVAVLVSLENLVAEVGKRLPKCFHQDP
jgi:hypothetical protein